MRCRHADWIGKEDCNKEIKKHEACGGKGCMRCNHGYICETHGRDHRVSF